MNQAMQNLEDVLHLPQMIFHEGHHNILDGIEYMDDIFVVHEEERYRDHEHDEENLKIEKPKDPNEITKELNKKQRSQ